MAPFTSSSDVLMSEDASGSKMQKCQAKRQKELGAKMICDVLSEMKQQAERAGLPMGT